MLLLPIYFIRNESRGDCVYYFFGRAYRAEKHGGCVWCCECVRWMRVLESASMHIKTCVVCCAWWMEREVIFRCCLCDIFGICKSLFMDECTPACWDKRSLRNIDRYTIYLSQLYSVCSYRPPRKTNKRPHTQTHTFIVCPTFDTARYYWCDDRGKCAALLLAIHVAIACSQALPFNASYMW